MSAPSRRELLGGLAASAALGALGCSRATPPGEAALWFAYGGKNRETLLGLVEEFARAHAPMRVRATYQGDYFEALAKLRTALAAGTPPALTHVVGEVVPYLAKAGVLEPLDELGSSSSLGLVPGLAQDGAFVGGREHPLVALPFNRSTPIAYYHRGLFAELGLAPPTTWDELRQVARAATRRRADGQTERYGFGCPIDWWFWVALVGQAGGVIVNEAGEVTLGGEAGVEALALWQAMVHDDRSMRPPPGRDYNAWQVTNTDFVQGRAAMIWTSTAFLRYLEETARFPVGAAPLPRGLRASVPTGGTFFVMPRGAAPEARATALAFLRFMMAPAQAASFATKTGYIPVSARAIEDLERAGFYAQHPNDRVALDQLASVAPWPWSSTLFRVQRELVQPMLEGAVLERRPARAAIAEACRLAKEP